MTGERAPSGPGPGAGPGAGSGAGPGADLAAFEKEARAFLDARLPPRPARTPTDRVALLEEIDPEREAETLRAAKLWQAALYDAGYAELEGERAEAFAALLDAYDVPDLQPLLVGLHIVAPAVRTHGSDDLKRRRLRPLLRGEVTACQLFSEPDAGSDLASVRTRAVRDGDAWTVTGQKVWSSGAHHADLGEALVRTDPDAPKHKGLTLFLIDMRAPGVEVRPLRQMTGGASFNEVFLTGVRVPDADRIGPLNGGWKAAITSLSSERAALGGAVDAVPPDLVERLAEQARRRGRLTPATRARLGRLDAALTAARLVNRRDDLDPAAAASVSKLLVNRAVALAVEAASAVLGPALAADLSDGGYAWSEFLLGAPALRIAGGTDEIQRTILAERHLGLPRDPR
ncbi:MULTISPECIES: acyl-CoA dehydrogenase family protein [Actinomadura]|uniref:Acyl-CoA dehydrogenase family protein n=1 Tax=Actinomadura yumaensis TaxID=111807 RepID=A0ABW2CZL9_9ACTN|nr:acyl-CoA dehydrogenase family protein [Actinomadura sp. J1-007]MWK38930.1 acyl-CoA dehydrogenase [Actinomadura sp. J1-007]